MNSGDNNKDLNAIVGNINETKTKKSEIYGLNELNNGISFKSGEDPLYEQSLRRQSNRVRDYISKEGLSEEENMAYLTIFAPNDPVLYKEAIKDAKLRTMMSMKI